MKDDNYVNVNGRYCSCNRCARVAAATNIHELQLQQMYTRSSCNKCARIAAATNVHALQLQQMYTRCSCNKCTRVAAATNVHALQLQQMHTRSQLVFMKRWVIYTCIHTLTCIHVNIYIYIYIYIYTCEYRYICEHCHDTVSLSFACSNEAFSASSLTAWSSV